MKPNHSCGRLVRGLAGTSPWYEILYFKIKKGSEGKRREEKETEGASKQTAALRHLKELRRKCHFPARRSSKCSGWDFKGKHEMIGKVFYFHLLPSTCGLEIGLVETMSLRGGRGRIYL